MTSATVKPRSSNERALKLLTLFSLLLIGYLVSGQQPVQKAFETVIGGLHPAPEADSRLLLTDINIGTTPRTAIINGRVVAPGDSVTLNLGTHPTPLRVVRIERNGVTILLQGEGQPRFLARK